MKTMATISRIYWQAKIWGLLHDPALKSLRSTHNLGDEGAWRVNGEPIAAMQGWVSPKEYSAKKYPDYPFSINWLKHIGQCDLIASASDRTSIGRIPRSVIYKAQNQAGDGLEVSHLLSGKKQHLKISSWHNELAKNRQKAIEQREGIIPESIRTCPDARKVFWWFWRCYPELLSQETPEAPLLPAETRIPDASLWSHTSMTAALAGGLAGFFPDESYPAKGVRKPSLSYPNLATFTFTPVQQLIEASRKMRDLWAGSWLLHYLSAKVCWDIAWKYGPDTLLYPCLYAQPLIDIWLLREYPDFQEWIQQPSERSLLTAGFPNVLVAILPDNGVKDPRIKTGVPVQAAMQQAWQSLHNEWLDLGDKTLDRLRQRRDKNDWNQVDDRTWKNWLQDQWQHYWVTLPMGDRNQPLDRSLRDKQKNEKEIKNWLDAQNAFMASTLLEPGEKSFVEAIFADPEATPETEDFDEDKSSDENSAQGHAKNSYKQPNLNVGSWWADLFDRLRMTAQAVKNARNWTVPTAFGPRSTISGLGPVVHPVYNPQRPDWATEGETGQFWKKGLGFFDGKEQLNATETIKRLLPEVLAELFTPENRPITWHLRQGLKDLKYTPDLSAGVAGWLRRYEKGETAAVHALERAYEKIYTALEQTDLGLPDSGEIPWGIPWIADHYQDLDNPRLLNVGWLLEDLELTEQEDVDTLRFGVEGVISKVFKGNNPTDWYVLAQGDGDGMSNWLKGKPLLSYGDYIPQALKQQIPSLKNLKEPFEKFLGDKKRMGPASHSALSRSLLDFSNQLVPYLTEQRYAGRLIYSGGDDVLAYTNLWEWDAWLWDIRQCFQGAEDPHDEFNSQGDYWRWKTRELPDHLSDRPLFTLGSKATISFGIVIANQGVPLAIALENLRAAEKAAKDHEYLASDERKPKDAVQVRVLYQNGNILKATAKFDTFDLWRSLLNDTNQDPSLFEQAAEVWKQHPAPCDEAITPWTQGFCSRRDALKNDSNNAFQAKLDAFLKALYLTTTEDDRTTEIANWLKLAAFVLRKRKIDVSAITTGGEP